MEGITRAGYRKYTHLTRPNLKATVQLSIYCHSEICIGHVIVTGYTIYPGTNKTGEASLWIYTRITTLSMLIASEQMEVIDSPKLLLYFHTVLHQRLYCCFSRERTRCSVQ